MAVVFPSYMNTLLFSIVSLALCVGLMLLILAGEGRDIFPLLLVVDVGVLIVILIALSYIVNSAAATGTTSSALAKDNQYDNKNTVIVRNCPDYYDYTFSVTDPTSQHQNITCNNQITLFDMVSGASITYVLDSIKTKAGCAADAFTKVDTTVDLNSLAVPQPTSPGGAPPAPNAAGATDATICGYVMNKPNLPWTFIRPIC